MRESRREWKHRNGETTQKASMTIQERSTGAQTRAVGMADVVKCPDSGSTVDVESEGFADGPHTEDEGKKERDYVWFEEFWLEPLGGWNCL